MKEKLYQRQRYRCATVFVDHFSGLSFVFLQQSTSAVETLQAKAAFEHYADTFGVKITHYHADNSRFAERVWNDDIERRFQTLTFSGVGAHHQNGRAEKRIRDLQDQARTSLIHANKLCPDAIGVELWPYALRHANDCFNMSPFPNEQETPLEKFSRSKIRPDFKQVHPFGCPAYALDGRIQSSKKAKKWEVRARVAIYLGSSPQHARTVGLVLSLTTGLVSPQFHVKYDESFSTLRNNAMPKLMWQQLAGFSPVVTSKIKIIEQSSLPKSENNGIEQIDAHDEDEQTTEQRSIHEDQEDDQMDFVVQDSVDDSDLSETENEASSIISKGPHTIMWQFPLSLITVSNMSIMR
jgi:hypothetical protein